MKGKHSELILGGMLLLLPATVFGSGTANHVTGTVAATDGSQFVLERPAGNDLVIIVSSYTRFVDLNGASTEERPEVGDPVRIDVMGGWTGLAAIDVQFSAPTKPEPTDHASAAMTYSRRDPSPN